MAASTVDTSPGYRVVRADVSHPVWDEYTGLVVMPAGLSDEEADGAMLAMVRERVRRAGAAAADRPRRALTA